MTSPWQIWSQICADPNNEALRREYAKHTPYPEHAELITLQLDRIAGDAKRGEYASSPTRRERELLANFEQMYERQMWERMHWLESDRPRRPREPVPLRRIARPAPWDKNEVGYAVNRGFVEWMRVDAQLLVTDPDAIATTAPVLHLEVVPSPSTPLRDVLKSPLVSRLDSLSLPGWNLRDSDVTEIATSDVGRSLSGLFLDRNHVTAAGAETLASMRNLVLVELSNNPGDPGDVAGYDEHDRLSHAPSSIGKRIEAKIGPVPWFHAGFKVDRFHLRSYRSDHPRKVRGHDELELAIGSHVLAAASAPMSAPPSVASDEALQPEAAIGIPDPSATRESGGVASAPAVATDDE